MVHISESGNNDLHKAQMVSYIFLVFHCVIKYDYYFYKIHPTFKSCAVSI